MKTKVYLLLFIISTFSCSDSLTSKEGKHKADKKQVKEGELAVIEKSIDSTTFRKEDSSTQTDIKIEISSNLEFLRAQEVHMTLTRIEVVEESFYHLLDSLVKREKKCMDSNIEGLHWTINEFQEDIYTLTLASEVIRRYEGFFYIDEMLFMTSADLPNVYKPTNKMKEFHFERDSLPYPEDYSVYLFTNFNGEIKIVESYLLPCD